MRPDDEQLERQLSAAGDRARGSHTPEPDAAFAASLRDRLLAQYPPALEGARCRGEIPRSCFLPAAPGTG